MSGSKRCAAWIACAWLAASCSASCGQPANPPVSKWEAPFLHPGAFFVDKRGIVPERPPHGNYRRIGGSKTTPARESAVLDSACRVHSALGDAIDLADANPETLMMCFRDTVQIPQFPRPVVALPRTAPANVTALAQADSLVLALQTRRNAQFAADTAFIQGLGGTVLETYWLIQAFEVAIPLSHTKTDSLLSNPELVRIEPRWIQSQPPQCTVTPGTGTNPTDLVVGRTRIGAINYSAPTTTSWIGLLDTGVRETHLLLNGTPAHLGLVLDCVNGGANCTGKNPYDEDAGHGTSSAGVIAAFGVPDDRLRGVTDGMLDSYKVWFMRGKKWNLDVCATVRGFQLAVKGLDQVIVAEMQDTLPPSCPVLGSIEDAANHAFDAGAVVVAADGNWGAGCATSPPGVVCSGATPGIPRVLGVPASACRVLGIGDYDLDRGCCDPSASWNQTTDGRLKPDVQLPTTTRTAGNKNDCDLTSYGGTSAATAYAGGALAILRNLAPRTDPGQAYSLAILAGQEIGPFHIGEKGAGHLQLFWNDHVAYDKVSVSPGSPYELPLTIPATGATNFRAAIWWPEDNRVTPTGSVTYTHNDIDLTLMDSPEHAIASSATVPGVFERIAVPSLSGGTYTLRISAKPTAVAAQTVYYSYAMKY